MSALRRLAARLVWILPFTALGIAACEHNPAEPGYLARITVTRNPETLAVGTTVQFTATGYDAAGNVVGINPTWSVAAGGGTINTSGVFLAGTTPGSFANTVVATVGSLSGAATAIVTGGPVATITLTPPTVTLATNTNQQYTAVGKDYAGNVVAISPNWSVAAGGGTIGGTGLFTSGMAPGTYTGTVKASVGGVSATASVTVDASALATITVTPSPVTLALGGTQTFIATGKDGAGNVISPLTFTWSNVTAAAGSIVSGTGVFTAGTTAGTYAATVKATIGLISGTATVTVSAGAVASITVTPTPDTLAIGATQQFTAVVKDASNNVLAITPNWSVAAGGGTISTTGLFTAGTLAGTYTNTATASVGSVHGAATVTVSAGALAIITVTPSPITLAIGANQTFAAVGKDAFGNIVPVTPTWAVVASGGAIVSTTGVFTAGTLAGLFANTIRACSTALCTSGSVSGFATVTVSAGALATITVAPNPAAVGTNASQPFTAIGRDANNNIIPIAPTWSMLTGAGLAGGTILSPSGVYTAPNLAGSGIDSVRACSTALCGVGSIAGFARVNVTASGALVSIVVTPNPTSVIAGTTVQYTATGYDATSLIVPTPGLAWSVVASQSAAGTINGGTGLFTAGTTAGTFINAIQATSGPISGFASLTVTPLQVGPSLGAAETHGILAGSAVTCASPPGTINADASVWPGSAFTGFGAGLCTITGQEHAADLYAQTAQGDLTTAFLALAALPCGTTITSDLGGTTLAEGVYCSGTSVGVTGTVTLTGNANSLFVIRAASTITTAGNVVMAGTALAKNVYWWAGSSATLGVGSQWQGNVLALQSITLAGTVNLVGRALARNGAVSLNGTGNVITLP
jgi:hypothetical protein